MCYNGWGLDDQTPYINVRCYSQNTTAADLQAMQEGAAGAGLAIKQILLALINNEPAAADLRDAVGGNLTSILMALQDLSSCVHMLRLWNAADE